MTPFSRRSFSPREQDVPFQSLQQRQRILKEQERQDLREAEDELE